MRTCPLGSMLWGRRSASSPSDAQLCTHGFDDSLSGCCEGGCLFAYYGFRGSGRGSIDPIRFAIRGCLLVSLPCSLSFLADSGCQLVSLPPAPSCPCPAMSWHTVSWGTYWLAEHCLLARGTAGSSANRGSSLGETTCRSALLNGEQVLMGDERQLARLLAL